MNIIEDALNFSIEQAKTVGMQVSNIDLELFLKPVILDGMQNESDLEKESDSESDDNFLGANLGEVNVENDSSDDDNQISAQQNFSLQNMTFLDKHSGNLIQFNF